MRDPFDNRDFRIWVSFYDDGKVRAVHAFDSSLEDPLPGAVDVTSLAPADFTNVMISPMLLIERAVRHDALYQQLAATSLARAQYVDATEDVVKAIAAALTPETPM